MPKLPSRRLSVRRIFLLVVAGCLAVTTPGCVGMVAHLINVGWGNNVPAKFVGLREKRVAVVCVSRSSAFGPSSAADEIAGRVETKLKNNVPSIEIIDQETIANWMDHNDWNELDYREIGEGVNAEMVVAIDIASFSFRDGQTLFRGRAEVNLAVYDITAGGTTVFEEIPPQIVFPTSSGQHTGETNEAAFRRRFIDVLATRLARSFYAYDATTDFGGDALLLSE